MICMRPVAIALNCNVKNIQNDVRQKIIMIIYEKSQLNRPVWGSLTLAPISAFKYFMKIGHREGIAYNHWCTEATKINQYENFTDEYFYR